MRFMLKEMFYSLQGEGQQSGRAAVFCRFAGCNLWNGREQDRASAECDFCDTDFVGTDGVLGGRYSLLELLDQVEMLWEGRKGKPYVILTGGEPLLQMTQALVDGFQQRGFEVAIETNGTKKPPENLDWVCVSPKVPQALVLHQGDELKLIYPQKLIKPADFEGLNFKYFYLQPLDGESYADNLAATLEYCLLHPQWRLSLQTHKIVNIC